MAKHIDWFYTTTNEPTMLKLADGTYVTLYVKSRLKSQILIMR